jgi:hypothetical protein
MTELFIALQRCGQPLTGTLATNRFIEWRHLNHGVRGLASLAVTYGRTRLASFTGI